LSNSRLDEKQIVKMLLIHRELTVPKLAELLNSSDGSVDYHLKKLLERRIVAVKKKKYGSLYSLSEDRVSTSNRTSIEFAATLVFLVFGLLFIQIRLDIAIGFLAVSSFIGSLSSISNAVRERREKIKTLLDLV
jgi:DNA-binding transcriptional ArsR family regulator